MHCENVFILTLRPHRVSINEVLSFILDLAKLDKGMVLTINSDKKAVLAFSLFFTKDTP
jgi:hypothetical protein